MDYEHHGMRLWVEPDERLASGAIEPGSDVTLKIGVEPADASNRVQIRYRVNSGPTAEIAAEPVRHVGNTQFFKAQLPSAALRDGDTMEYSAGCQCAGQRVSSAVGAEQFAASFRVINVAAKGSHAVALRSATRLELAPAIAAPQDMATRDQTVQLYTKRLKPTHLSLFVLEEKTGHPITRMPFYAEVGVTSFLPPAKTECKLEEGILSGLQDFRWRDTYSLYTPSPTKTLVEPLCDALTRLLPQETIDRMAVEPAYAGLIISGILQIAKELARGKKIDLNDPETLRKLLDDAIRDSAKEQGLPLAEIPAQAKRIVWAHPLGILATDHIGYLSFDLTRLPSNVADAVALALEARRLDPNTPTDTSIWLYPMAREANKIDALAQGRFAHDAIVVKLELEQPVLPAMLENLGLLAMQNPDLTDWRLSPGSFATNPASLVGKDGCETLLPANVALQEFYFYQVVGLTDAQDVVPNELRDCVRLGVIHEYRLAWYPLGHSLGQILYSLPLAPGESVNLAVIDWTRRDDAQRKEHTTLDEQLVHNEHRDRTISETVDAAVHEYQHGSSFMGGISGALGGSYMGVSAGVAGSLGGSTSNSSGSRDVAATTVQKLSDNITQASSAQRELQSTVVVHSTQSEKEAIETRTVVNYNHSHALTILYYEVLRHFRVATELVRRRPAVLVKAKTTWFEGSTAAQNILEHRTVLEGALLDAKFAEGFNALERLNHRGPGDPLADFTKPLPAPPAPAPPNLNPPPFFHYFTLEMTTGGFHREVDAHDQHIDVLCTLLLKDDGAIDLVNIDGGVVLNNFGAFSEEFRTNTFTALPKGQPVVPWASITGLVLAVAVFPTDGDTAKVSFSRIKLTGVDVSGPPGVPLLDQSYENGHLIVTNANDELGKRRVLPTLRPPTPPAPAPFFAPTDVADHAKGGELIAHLQKHKRYYSRAILLNQNPVEQAGDLEDLHVLEHLDNRPLEIVGDYVAYLSTDPVWNERIKPSLEPQPGDDDLLNERLVTLPTRGVFAEAKLGHCNASEEMDPTRFWKWEEHPIPHMAPEIAPIQGVTPQPQQQNISPTAFPQSLVNIVNPPNAPDPTGLAGAMNVLAASNIFRDMSGRAEVADLLKKLSDSSVAIAGTAQKAATGGAAGPSGGSGGGGSGGGGGGATGTTRPSAPKPTPSEQHEQLQVYRNAEQHGDITPDERQKYAHLMFASALGDAGTDAGSGDAGAGRGADAGVTVFAPLPQDFQIETPSIQYTKFFTMERRNLRVGVEITSQPTDPDTDTIISGFLLLKNSDDLTVGEPKSISIDSKKGQCVQWFHVGPKNEEEKKSPKGPPRYRLEIQAGTKVSRGRGQQPRLIGNLSVTESDDWPLCS